MVQVVLIISLLISLAQFGESKLPTVGSCKYGDTDCMQKIGQVILQKYYAGLDEINLLSLDPLLIDAVTVATGGNGPINLKFSFKDVKMVNLKDGTVDKMVGFPKEFDGSTNEIDFSIPDFTLLGPYKLSGKMILIQIEGTGNCNITFENIKGKLIFTGKKVSKDGKDYFHTDDLKLTFTTTHAYMNFDNLFNGNDALTKSTNQLLNQNWKEIFVEIKTSINTAFAKVFQKIINNVFDKFPYNEMFEE